jgi:hypothetical protein
MTKTKMLAAAGASALMLAFGSASWGATTISLTDPNSTLSAFPGPYGLVTINLLDSTDALIDFTSNTVGIFKYFLIDGGIADVNVNAKTWTIHDFTTNGLGSPSFVDDGSNNISSFGVFNQTTKQHDGYGSRATDVSFKLTNKSGTWASEGAVLALNADNEFVAAHIAVCDLSKDSTCKDGGTFTGFASGGVEKTTKGGGVPEPASWALMISGFGLTGAMLRLRRRRAAA